MVCNAGAPLTFVLAEIVLEQTEGALRRKVAGGDLIAEFRALMERLAAEKVPHVSRSECESARMWIRHQNDVIKVLRTANWMRRNSPGLAIRIPVRAQTSGSKCPSLVLVVSSLCARGYTLGRGDRRAAEVRSA